MKKALGLVLAVLLGTAGTGGGEEERARLFPQIEEEIPSRPFLRIETGMHTAIIRKIDADAAGRFLVTGSDDKTVRAWDLASGRLLRTLRLPIGEGVKGEIRTVAISPDGELVAAGRGGAGHSWNESRSIYLFERRSGRLIRRWGGLPPDSILSLAFSSDGSRLAAGFSGALSDVNLRVFRVSDGEELGKVTDYGNSGYGVSFAADGRLVTAGFNGEIRLYDHDLHLLKSVEAPGMPPMPVDTAFSPDGRRIAVSYANAYRVDVLDASDLHSLYVPDSRDVDSILVGVTWSADGTLLYAAGQVGELEGGIRRWADAGRGAYQDFTGSARTVMDLRALPEGRLAFGSADPAWGVLDASGKRILGQDSSIADLRNTKDGFRVDSAGTRIQLAFEGGRPPVRFSIPERRLLSDVSEDPRLAPPRTSLPGLEGVGTEEPKMNGKLALDPTETAVSLAVAPDGTSLLLGTYWSLYALRSDGTPQWSVEAPGPAWAVNLTGDGRLAVAAFGDGTIRWYRADNGKELLAFFPHADGKRWVLWTPGGYYDASVGGEDLIGWHVNNGPDREADFFPAWQFRDRFHKPQVIDFILETLDEAEALRRAGIQAEAQLLVQKGELPPVVTILDPADGAEVTTPSVTVRINVRSPSGKPVTRVWASMDGQPIESRSAEYVPAGPQPPDLARDFERNLEVPLPPGDHFLEVIAAVAGRISTPARIAVRRTAQEPPAARRLFALAVGIADYAKAEYKLSFADDDARAVADLLRGQKGRSFDTVEVRELIDQKATLDALTDGLQWLAQSVGSEDTAVIFFAGHGVNDREYFFLPYDANLVRPLSTVLSQSQMQEILTRLRGRVLLFLDTCHAGAVFGGSDDERRRQVDVTALINSLMYSPRGLVIFSAAGGRELSQERADWGHGAFTTALLEALRGAADVEGNRNGEITTAELEGYLTERVRDLTGGAQTPIQIKPPGVPSFPFVKVGERVMQP